MKVAELAAAVRDCVMDNELRAVVRCLHGIQHELCELREALEDIDQIQVVYLNEEPEELEDCDCEDCLSL